MSAIGSEADVRFRENTDLRWPLSANSGHANHQIPYVPPTRNIFAGKPKPIKALNDYVIQHAISIVIVIIVTKRCVLRFTKRITAVATAKDRVHRVDSSGDLKWGYRRGWQAPVGGRVRPKENAEEEYSVESGLDARVPGT
jgi:hypothetical protein